MDGDQRPDAQLTQIGQLLAVMVYGLLRWLALLRHEPRPFQSQPAHAQPHGGHKVAVLAPAVPVVVGQRRVGAVLDMTPMEPVVPIASDLSALDLGRGRGNAQQKMFREAQLHP